MPVILQRLRTLTTAAVATLAAICGLDASAEVLVNANWNHKTDTLGFRWDIQHNGAINDGTDDCFDGGMMLLVNQNQFNPNDYKMTQPEADKPYALTVMYKTDLPVD